MFFQKLRQASDGSRCKSDSVSCLPAPWCTTITDLNGCRTCECNSEFINESVCICLGYKASTWNWEPPPLMLYPVIMRYCFKEHGEPCNSPFPPPPQKKGYKQIEYTEYFELRIIFSLSVFLRLSYVLFVYIFVCYLFCLF